MAESVSAQSRDALRSSLQCEDMGCKSKVSRHVRSQGELTIIANAMPIAKAQPIWKSEPKTGIPTSAPTPLVVAKVKEATEAIPGKT